MFRRYRLNYAIIVGLGEKYTEIIDRSNIKKITILQTNYYSTQKITIQHNLNNNKCLTHEESHFAKWSTLKSNLRLCILDEINDGLLFLLLL